MLNGRAAMRIQPCWIPHLPHPPDHCCRCEREMGEEARGRPPRSSPAAQRCPPCWDGSAGGSEGAGAGLLPLSRAAGGEL